MANSNPFAAAVPDGLMEQILGESQKPLSSDFHFGAATAAFQIESGNVNSDWYAWEQLGRIKNKDTTEQGPRAEEHVADDVALMKATGLDSYRFGIEWGRLFPTREAFDALEPDAMALAYYHSLLDELHAAGIRPMVTVQHFTLPIWLQNPPNPEPKGLLDDQFIPLLTKFAAWCGSEFGNRVDYWITVNEPSGIVGGGFADGSFPPGKLADFGSFQKAYLRMAEAHARMYDAIRETDHEDADGDGMQSMISFATHNRMWLPLNPESEADVTAARRLRYISNVMLVDSAVCGNLDKDIDENWGKGDRVSDPALRSRLDFIALNYYGTAYVTALDVEPYKGVPILANKNTTRPVSDFGWDISPEGLIPVLDELKLYGLPVIITESGLADAADNRRPKFLVDTLATIQSAIGRGHDVRGYYHWSLYDNFEWAAGYCTKFGLYSIDQSSPLRTRIERPSVSVYRQIAEARSVSAELRGAYSYGPATPCE